MASEGSIPEVDDGKPEVTSQILNFLTYSAILDHEIQVETDLFPPKYVIPKEFKGSTLRSF